METTTASVHDSQVDLSRKGEVSYKDKGYHGVRSRGYDATMKRASRGHPLSIWDRLRNARISRKRAPGERPFAVIKRVFGSGHVLVTTVGRVHLKMVFSCFCFNLVQLGSLGVGRSGAVLRRWRALWWVVSGVLGRVCGLESCF